MSPNETLSRVAGAYLERIDLSPEDLSQTTVRDIRWTNLTDRIQKIVASSGVQAGLVVIQTLHTTTMIREGGLAGSLIRINESEDGLAQTDIPRSLRLLARLLQFVMKRGTRLGLVRIWQHDRPERLEAMPGEPANAVSHLLATIFGNASATLVVDNGKIALGTWQQILFYDLDVYGGDHGVMRKRRTVIVQVVGTTQEF